MHMLLHIPDHNSNSNCPQSKVSLAYCHAAVASLGSTPPLRVCSSRIHTLTHTCTEGNSLLSQARMPAHTHASMPATTAYASSEPSSLLSIVDRTAYDRLIKSIADDLPQATQQKFRGREGVNMDDDSR